MVKERPILFSGAMVRAILAGTKTQTRRVFKYPGMPRDEQPHHICQDGGGNWVAWFGEDKPGFDWNAFTKKAYPNGEGLKCPYGQPGDQLWVRETCRGVELEYGIDGVCYVADNAFREISDTQEAVEQWLALYHYRKQRGAIVPTIHMPRWASRILLEITSVRVERLQDISEADAQAEGVNFSKPAYYELGSLTMIHEHNHGVEAFADVTGARAHYAMLWNEINGPRAWEANPWVWVVEFKRVEGETNG